MHPTVDNGFVRIATELMDAILIYPFTKREYKIILAVIRKTYGYNKKSDDMTNSQLVKITGLDKSHVTSTVAVLATRNILIKKDGRYGYLLELNKYYTKWLPKQLQDKVLPKQLPEVAKTAIPSSQNSQHNRHSQKTTTKDKVPETKIDFIFPNWLNKNAWLEFEQHRKEINKPLTDLARKKNLTILEKHQDRQSEIIDATIAHRWQGLFAPKNNAMQKNTRKLSVSERATKARRRVESEYIDEHQTDLKLV